MAGDPEISKVRRKLGEILVGARLISSAQLEEALSVSAHAGRRLGQVLVDQGRITEQDLARGLSEQLGFPFADLGRMNLNPRLSAALHEGLAKRHHVIPLQLEGKTLTIATADPLNFEAINDLSFSSGYVLRTQIATPAGIKKALGMLYAKRQPAQVEGDAAEGAEVSDRAFLEALAAIETPTGGVSLPADETAQPSPIVRLSTLLVTNAVRFGASDIHLEPGPSQTTVRLRIDGLLRKTIHLPKAMHAPLVSRFKVLSNLDIAERRLPQDGAFRVKIEQRDIDLRVSTMPTLHGEKLVLRIQDPMASNIRLESLGLGEKDLATIEGFTERRKGIILVTGPTGSGKTTTLYALIHAIRSVSLNILTVEDPVESKIESITQTQINPDAGLSFARALRSILRQDPDVILIGEIRDLETAEIAMRAAMTGHLVLSTLHTNDALSAITRLVDLGVPRYLVASMVEGVIAQRLVRMICKNCKKEQTPSPAALLALKIPANIIADVAFYAGSGCAQCGGTGYAGRIAIMEILDPTALIREMIAAEATEQDLRMTALASRMTSLGEDGLNKAKAGITTVEELLRVVEVSNKIESLCPKCARIVQYDFLACPYCETALSRICQGCRRPSQLDWKLCPYCGRKPDPARQEL
jgi:type IV pilus assembly protein PilB